MDENYARKLRNWLRAEPGATPSGASQEREWLREIPEPASDEQADTPERWTVRGQLPEPPAPEARVCPVIVLPVPRSSGENGCRMSGVEVRLRWSDSSNADGGAEAPDASRVSDAEARSRWSHPSNADRRAETPDPSRAEAPNPSPMTDAEARSRWNHPTNWHRRRAAEDQRRRDQDGTR